MVRKTALLLLVLGVGGCMTMDSGPVPGGCPGSFGRSVPPPNVPGLQGAWGQPVPIIPPYTSRGAMYPQQAYAMMNNNVPLGMVQMGGGGPGPGYGPPGGSQPPFMVPQGGLLAPPGLPFAPGIPPQGMLATGAPGSVAAGNVPAHHMRPASGPVAGPVPAGGPPYPAQRSQVRFARPSGMKVAWFTQGLDGRPAFSSTTIEVPGRYNFLQGAIYRLKLSNLEGHPGLELYPTLEVVPANPKTAAFLAHSAVPVDFTEEDVKQITQGNYVVKVIYLPDPQFQELAGTGTEEILSTRLEPGADPIQEALRRGSILLVVRMGNVDQEAPNTPPFGAPSQPQGPVLMAPPPAGMYPLPSVRPHGFGQCPPPYCHPSIPPAPGMNSPTKPPAPGTAGPNTKPATESPKPLPPSSSTTPAVQPGAPSSINSPPPQPSGGAVFTPKAGETATPISPTGATTPWQDALPRSAPPDRPAADPSAQPAMPQADMAQDGVRPGRDMPPPLPSQDGARPGRDMPPPLPPQDN